MNDIAKLNSAPTMSSREIADLVESRHDSVKRSIDRLADSGVIVRPPVVDEHSEDSLGRARVETVYMIGKRDSYVIVAQLSPEFTARLVDRWQELEAAQSTKPPSELSRLEILQIAMESEQARIKAERERDEAIRTKAQIGSRREASAMAAASAAKREASKLRDLLGANTRHATVTAVQNATGTKYAWLPLRKWCEAHGATPECVPDTRYGEVKAWPADAWGDVHAVSLHELFGKAS